MAHSRYPFLTLSYGVRIYLVMISFVLLSTFAGMVNASDSHEWSMVVTVEGDPKKSSVEITAGHPKHGEGKYFSDKNGAFKTTPSQKTDERSFKAADEVWEFEIQTEGKETKYSIDVFMDKKPVMHLEWSGKKDDPKNKADSNGLVSVVRTSRLNETGEGSYKVDCGKKGTAGAIPEK